MGYQLKELTANINKEKLLQKIIEYNMQTLFGLQFIATEVSLADFRLDTLAYDSKTNSFVIVEYKKTKAEGLVDQGHSYLGAVLDRKDTIVNKYIKKLIALRKHKTSIGIQQKYSSLLQALLNSKNIQIQKQQNSLIIRQTSMIMKFC